MEQIYADEQRLNKKIKLFKEQGIDKIHVVSDFDKTLSKCFYEGRKIPSTIALIREGGYLRDDYPKKAFALYDKYYPIEVDDSLYEEYKTKKMYEWWHEHEKLLVSSGMHKAVIDDIVSKYPKIFRPGYKEFFHFLSKRSIPILIFSAGIGNIIEAYLKKENLLSDNVHILSNFFEFDEKGFAIGYKSEIIHCMNKSETKISDPRYREMVSERNNVILLGDSLGDLGMADNIGAKHIIRIGFLNEKIEEKLGLYMSKFDIVIAGDGSLEYVNSIFSKLI